MIYTISKDEMAKLLGRSLSSAEEDNFDNLLGASKSKLESILGVKIDGDKPRSYNPVPGFSQIFIDPFTDVNAVRIGNCFLSLCSFEKLRFDDLNADWFNSLIFCQGMGLKPIEVDAAWGFGADLPGDLALLWAGLFDITSSSNATAPAVSSEAILTHRVTFDLDRTVVDKFVDDNALVIGRYKKPFVGSVGSVM